MVPALAARRAEVRNDSDAIVVAGLLRGDEAVFLDLVHREHSAMIRYALVFVSTAAGAEEVVHEAWTRLLATLAPLEDHASLRVWLFGIVASCAKSRAALEARPLRDEALPEEDEHADPERFFGPGSPQSGGWMRLPEVWPKDCREQAETIETVRVAIEELPGPLRQVILLRDVEDWSAREVCDLLGLTEPEQRALLHRARSHVRTRLERQLPRSSEPTPPSPRHAGAGGRAPRCAPASLFFRTCRG